MCQILCLTRHDPKTRDKLIASVWDHMSRMGNQHDGYGAAWFAPNGEIGYHKARLPNFTYPQGLKDRIGKLCKKGFFDIESNDIPSDGGFLIIHGRNATCAVNVDNTHPMLAWAEGVNGPSAAMVHNGVVKAYKYRTKDTTCDSELLLQAYVSGGIKEVEKEIYGSYAFMHLALIDGHKTLHIAKDSKAKLQFGMLGEAGVFATTEGLLDHVKADHLGDMNESTLMILTDDDLNAVTSTFAPQIGIGPTATQTDLAAYNAAVVKAHGDYDDGIKASSYPPRNLSADSALDRAIADTADEEEEIAKLTEATD